MFMRSRRNYTNTTIKEQTEKNLLLLILLLQRFKILFNQKEDIFGRFAYTLFPMADCSRRDMYERGEFVLTKPGAFT